MRWRNPFFVQEREEPVTYKIFTIQSLENEVACFGEFDIERTICRKYCALRLRCAAYKQKYASIEQMEEWTEYSYLPLRLQ